MSSHVSKYPVLASNIEHVAGEKQRIAEVEETVAAAKRGKSANPTTAARRTQHVVTIAGLHMEDIWLGPQVHLQTITGLEPFFALQDFRQHASRLEAQLFGIVS
ncbi:hypothetical protein PG993_006319 [Apiospora rasikravindrae]|uniref:Uncharacterized protein n=1 Tax=Apiospora rasikravindrae TaxID=990691 RepID=A0ABR1T702_9PEZI